MELLHLILRYAHLLGFAALTIGVLLQFTSPQKIVNKLMLFGALIQLLTGFILVGVISSLGEDLNMTKISIKLGLIIMIVALSLIYRKKILSQAVYGAFLLLIFGASLTAVFL